MMKCTHQVLTFFAEIGLSAQSYSTNFGRKTFFNNGCWPIMSRIAWDISSDIKSTNHMGWFWSSVLYWTCTAHRSPDLASNIKNQIFNAKNQTLLASFGSASATFVPWSVLFAKFFAYQQLSKIRQTSEAIWGHFSAQLSTTGSWLSWGEKMKANLGPPKDRAYWHGMFEAIMNPLAGNPLLHPHLASVVEYKTHFLKLLREGVF